MQQIGTVWANLDRRRQIVVAGAVVLVFLGVLAMSRLVTAPSMTLLYAGLESGAAGDIVRGASLVVWAIREGRDAAEHMHKYLRALESADLKTAAE